MNSVQSRNRAQRGDQMKTANVSSTGMCSVCELAAKEAGKCEHGNERAPCCLCSKVSQLISIREWDQ